MVRMVQEQNLEKQMEKQMGMGCMAGFLQIFDRHQVLTGKRLYATKRLPPSSVVDSVSESDEAMASPAVSRELDKQLEARSMSIPERSKQSQVTELSSPAQEAAVPAEIQSKLPLPLPIFELKEGTKSSWKFCKEAPRLSLDSRATFDAKGGLKPRGIRTNAAFLPATHCENKREEIDDNEKQRRSPNVIARLMGLEPLADPEAEQVNKPELRRSASESRASKDLFQYRFIDGVNFQLQQAHQQNTPGNVSSNVIRESAINYQTTNVKITDRKEYIAARNVRAEPARIPHRGIGQRKSVFDSADFFPEPKQTVSICGEIEKRLKVRGIVEPSKDLETLKQMLDALQLKGLLHSKKPSCEINHRNFVYDRNYPYDESPIVVMKPVRAMCPVSRHGRMGYNSPPSSFRMRPGVRGDSNLPGQTLQAMSPRRDRTEIERNVRNHMRGRSPSSPTRSESGVKSPNRRKPWGVETQKRVFNDSIEHRTLSPVQSPKLSARRNTQDHTTNPSLRNRKQTVEICLKEEKVFVPAEDETSTISESSISTSSQTDTERLKVEDYKEGRNILERCDKLLHSIAEMTATELQPSPVSVLDSSFYKEESSPSPVMKRSVDFKDQCIVELEDDIWSLPISPVQLKLEGNNSDDCDFIYISDIFQASNYLPEDADIFLLLEKQQYLKGKDTSEISRLHRKLIFDTITEILNRKRQSPPWKVISWLHSIPTSGQTSQQQQIWSEIQRIRERDPSDDLVEIICGVLKKDLAGDAINGWGDCPIEMSDAVLEIERMIFKDLIGETIRNLAESAGKFNPAPVPRRKLFF